MKNKVFAFDLDDTLYKEIEYKRSGFNYLLSVLGELYPNHKAPRLSDALSSSDGLGFLIKHYQLPQSIKDSLLWSYRTHVPDIELTPAVKNIIKLIYELKIPIYIITDGRELTQRLKILSLGLNYIDLLTSEKYGGEKPFKKRFELISKMHPNAVKYYIGDNIKKDFLAPNILGWTTIGLKADSENIHRQDSKNLSEEYLPDYWIENLTELKTYILTI